MSTRALCPALFISAPASGQGKTTVTAAIARYHSRLGKVVRVFKTGPDYLDPQILEQASGGPVEQLDMWMAGEAYCQQKLYAAAQVADLILIEGAMGLFDGEPSSADLAATYHIPIALVMDVKGMAQTAAAVAAGLASYRSDYLVVGIVANNCGSDRHAEIIADALPASLPLLAKFKRDPTMRLPERHLGLVQASEVEDELEAVFEVLANSLSGSALCDLPRPVAFEPLTLPVVDKSLAGLRLGIAKDAAFSFIYAANLNLLQEMGAELVFFSPMTDESLPHVDALWLPGGYPELHAERLANNTRLCREIQAFFDNDKPILAECGGFLYCLESLLDLEGRSFDMLGLLSGQGAMTGGRGCQGMQTALLPEGEVRAHAHHHAQSFQTPSPLAFARRQRHRAPGEAIYRNRGLTATFLHLFFPSNPHAIGDLFKGSAQAQTSASVG